MPPAGYPAFLQYLQSGRVRKYELRGEKWTKIPYQPHQPSQKAKADIPETWSSFEQAWKTYQADGFDGIGYEFAADDPYFGVDLDNCLRASEILAWSLSHAEALRTSYGEISPSGKGLKFIAKGKLPEDKGTRREGLGPDGTGALELYDHGRFFTITGDVFGGSISIADLPDVAVNLYRVAKPEKKPEKKPQSGGNGHLDPRTGSAAFTPKDEDVFTAIGRSKVAPKIRTLWSGCWQGMYASQSSGDEAMCNYLAYFCGKGNQAQAERLFLKSKLGQRGKATDRIDYVRRTVDFAYSGRTDFYQWAPLRPEITITTREHEVTDQAVAAIAADGNIFQRGGNLVAILEECKPQPKRTNIKRQPGSLCISLLPHAQIRRLMTVHADWVKIRINRDQQEKVPAHPPTWAVEAVATLGNWRGIRPLEGIVEAPMLRPDGSLIDQPGYDPDTGLWFVPSVVFPAIPDNPTKLQAESTMDDLVAVVTDFPFAGVEHQAAWLASCLTALARFAIDGPCPLFLFDANCPGTGKSKLCDVVAILATGREMARGAYPDDQSEMEKMLLSVALAGDRFVLFDNVASGFSVGGSALDRALTARTIKGRILGKSKMTPELPVNVVFYATGNNLGVRGDALRRIIPCRLETTEERPEERTGFKIQGDLLAYVKEHRGELVAAGLTILRAYIVAGRPDQGLTPMDYPAWCGLIRNAVKWVTAQDPCEARKELTMSDENTIERKALIDGWEALCSLANKQNLTAAEAREGVDQPALPSPAVVALRDIFMSWTRDGKLPSAKSIGRRIAKYRDRNCGGKCFKRTCSDPVAWYVQAV